MPPPVAALAMVLLAAAPSRASPSSHHQPGRLRPRLPAPVLTLSFVSQSAHPIIDTLATPGTDSHGLRGHFDALLSTLYGESLRT